MKVLNFGSLNYDYVYRVPHIVEPGETLSSTGLEIHCGGKGLNQSIAMARAGMEVYHAGMVGPDGGMLLDALKAEGINCDHIRTVKERSGNAIIQVSDSGQNSIVLFGGANRENKKEYVDEVLSHFSAGDYILLQNEINLLDYIIDQAFSKGMRIVLNPSPLDAAVEHCDLRKVSIFLLNEVEGAQIAHEKEPERILSVMLERFPDAQVVLTLGSKGVIWQHRDKLYSHGVFNVPVVDTTAAGDTFTGYFLAMLLSGRHIKEVLRIASVAASLAVSKKGAADSIPTLQEVLSAELLPLEQ